jgi:hypothetical protein
VHHIDRSFCSNISVILLSFSFSALQTRPLIVLDLEDAVRPDFWWWFTDADLQALVNAIGMRVQVLKSFYPHATWGLYAAPSGLRNLTYQCKTVVECDAGGKYLNEINLAEVMSGYARASKLGMFEFFDVSVPSLYLGPWYDVGVYTSLVMRAAAAVTKADMKTILPAAPYLSWVYFGGMWSPQLRCEVVEDAMRTQIEVLMNGTQSLLMPRLAMVQWWEGRDDRTPFNLGGHNCGSHENETMVDWLKRGDFVPAACPRTQQLAKRSEIMQLTQRPCS